MLRITAGLVRAREPQPLSEVAVFSSLVLEEQSPWGPAFGVSVAVSVVAEAWGPVVSPRVVLQPPGL
jgi:hypothetical protein